MSRNVKGEPEFSSEDIVRFLLEETSTYGPPTNAERIARFLKLSVRGFFHRQQRLDPKIRAYLWPAKREIGISKKLSRHRRKFSILHEVGHFVIPGHLDNLAASEKLLDDDQTLADHSVVQLEIDANRFAADCIFQLNRFQAYIDKHTLTWTNVSAFADKFDASLVATARRWVEASLAPCALIVFVPITMGDDVRLRYTYSVTSESFKKRFFARLTGFTLGEDSAAFHAFKNTRGYASLVERVNVQIENHQQEFDMMLFSTQYNVYGLIVA